MDAPAPRLSAELLLEHAPFVRSLARALLHDEHLAEDVVQEAWLRLSTRPLRDERGLRAWMRAVVQRISIDRTRESSRRAAREAAVARPEAQPSVTEEIAHTEVLRTVVEAVLALDEPYRSCVLLAYWRGWDARRIAEETKSPLATVRSRLQRAHAKIRERLDRGHERKTWGMALVAMSTRGLETGTSALALGTGAKLVLGAGALLGIAGLLWRTLGSAAQEPTGPAGAASIVLSPGDSRDGEETAEERATARSEVAASATARVIRIGGTVTDRAYAELSLPDRPAADLALRVGLASDEYSFRDSLASTDARTDAAGRFDLTFPDPGTRPLYLRVAAPEDEQYRSLWCVKKLDGDHAELELARAAHGVLHGTVVDDRNEPLRDVQLRFETEGGAREVTSGPAGAFAVEGMHVWRELAVELPGFVLVDAERAAPLEAGGWAAVRVRMGPGAALHLRVLDASGAGISGVQTEVDLDDSEKAALEMAWRIDWGSRRATTDESGAATLEGLWAGRKLRIALAIGGESFACEAAVGGELVLASAGARGQPIVLAPGAMNELVARVAVDRAIAGRVVLSGGSGVAGARVSVRDLGRSKASWNRPELLALVTDGDGNFAGRIRTAELAGPLLVEARLEAEHGTPTGGLGYAGSGGETSDASGETRVAADELEALRAIEVVIEPCLSMTGTIRDASGGPFEAEGFGVRIWAVAPEMGFDGVGDRVASIGADGRFELVGLPPGTYDLLVSEENESFYSFANFVHRFPSIAAGSQNLELRLPPHSEVRIRVRAVGGDVENGVVLHRKLFPEEPESFAAPRAGPRIRVTGAAGWPEGTTFDFTGIGGATLDAGTCMDGYDSLEGSEQELQPLEPGWYAIGIHPRDAAGEETWFPQATELLYFDAGEHVVEFELLRAASLRGSLVGGTPDEFLAVSLVDEHRRPVPLGSFGGRAEPALVHDASASGDFVLRYVPTGRFRLRAGSRAELERGEFRRELALEIQPGENARVELRL
jgi:RNA polymerase sigma-70 factor (ECF subfamily)